MATFTITAHSQKFLIETHHFHPQERVRAKAQMDFIQSFLQGAPQAAVLAMHKDTECAVSMKLADEIFAALEKVIPSHSQVGIKSIKAI